MTPATTLQAYGYDSYPYLHAARRRCMPYAQVLEVVRLIDAWGAHARCHCFDIAPLDYDEILRAWFHERDRRNAVS